MADNTNPEPTEADAVEARQESAVVNQFDEASIDSALARAERQEAGFSGADIDAALERAEANQQRTPLTAPEDMKWEGAGDPLTLEEALDMGSSAGTEDLPISLPIGSTEFEVAVADLEHELREQGTFDQKMIDKLVRPLNPDDMPVLSQESLDNFYEEHAEFFEKNQRIIHEATQMGMEMEKEGAALNPMTWSGLRLLVAATPEGYMTNMRAASKAAGYMGSLVRDGVNPETGGVVVPVLWQTGMAVIDSFVRLTNEWRLFWADQDRDLTPEEYSELRQKMLPPVRLKNSQGEERMFSTQASARFSIASEMAGNSYKWFLGKRAEFLGNVLHNGTLKSWGEAVLDEQTFVDYTTAAMIPAVSGQLPDIVAPLDVLEASMKPEEAAGAALRATFPYDEGNVVHDPYLIRGSYSGLDNELKRGERDAIIERVKAEGDPWPAWARIHDAGSSGVVGITQLAGINVQLEIWHDPFITTTLFKIPSLVRPGLRKLAQVADPQRAARFARGARVGANNVDNALLSVDYTRKALKQLQARATQEASLTGKVNKELMGELNKQTHNLMVEERNLARIKMGKKAATREELHVLEGIVRKKPEFIPDPKDPKLKQLALSDADVEVNLMGPVRAEDLPDNFKIARQNRVKHVEELQDELAAYRKREAARGIRPAYEVTQLNYQDKLTKQRALLGPDDVEANSDALAYIMRTGGYGLDDVAVPPPNPAYRWDANDVVTQYEWRQVDATDILPTERRAGINKDWEWTLEGSSERVLLRQEDRLRRSLGAARRNGLKDGSIEALEKELAETIQNRKVYKSAKAKAKKKPASSKRKPVEAEIDESWTGKAGKGITRSKEKFKAFTEAFADRYQASLYPGSIRNSLNRNSLSQQWQPLRDPIRFFETWDPPMAEHTRAMLLRDEQFTAATIERFDNILQHSGVLSKRNPKNPVRLLSNTSINKERSAQLFDLLNEIEGSPAFLELAEQADEGMMNAHKFIRAMLDDLADRQGLSGTSRYLEGYIMHMVDAKYFDEGLRPPQFLGMHPNADAFVRHLLDRKGFAEYEHDIVAVLDLYTRGAATKLYKEPLYDDLLQAGKRLTAREGNTKFSSYTEAFVANMKGKPSYAGSTFDHIGGKPVVTDPVTGKQTVQWGMSHGERVVGAATSLVWGANILGNPRYLLMQMASASTTTSAQFGLMRTADGVLRMMTKEGQDLAKTLGFYDTVNQLMESNALGNFMDVASEFTGITQTEALARGMTAHASLGYNMNKYGLRTLGEATQTGAQPRLFFEALRAAEEANHAFGQASRTPYLTKILGQPLGAAGSQFGLYPVKQTEVLAKIADDNPGKVAEYFIMGGYISRLAAQFTGVDMTQWTGGGYLAEMFGGGEAPASPLGDLAATWFEAGSSGMRDAQTSNDTWDKLRKSLDIFIPVLYRNLEKRNKRLNSGNATDTHERKIRELLHGASEETIQAAVEALTPFREALRPPNVSVENLRPSMTEGGLPEGVTGGVGGDYIPNYMMLPSIRDRLQRNAQTAEKNVMQGIAIKSRNLISDYADAMESGEEEVAEDLSRRIVQVSGGRIRMKDMSGRLINHMAARLISSQLRHMVENPAYADILWEIYSGAGVGMGVRSNGGSNDK